MYVSRRASQRHGTYQFHLALANAVATLAAALTASNPLDYAVIFLSSGLLYGLMEYRMERQGIRKSVVHVYGRQLSPLAACMMRGFTEGPCCCVAGFYFADKMLSGHPVAAWVGLAVFAVLYSAYSAVMDLRDLQRLPPEQRGIVGRRKMNSPKLVIGVPAVTAIALTGLFNMQQPWQAHGFYYLFGAFFVVGVFFIINRALGVRLIELQDDKTGVIAPASLPFTALAFTYDALFEMGFLFVIFYLVPYSLGLFSYSGVV